LCCFVVVVFSGRPDVDGKKEVKGKPEGDLHQKGAALALALGGDVAEFGHLVGRLSAVLLPLHYAG
jgi:hypothetical protein